MRFNVNKRNVMHTGEKKKKLTKYQIHGDDLSQVKQEKDLIIVSNYLHISDQRTGSEKRYYNVRINFKKLIINPPIL